MSPVEQSGATGEPQPHHTRGEPGPDVPCEPKPAPLAPRGFQPSNPFTPQMLFPSTPTGTGRTWPHTFLHRHPKFRNGFLNITPDCSDSVQLLPFVLTYIPKYQTQSQAPTGDPPHPKLAADMPASPLLFYFSFLQAALSAKKMKIVICLRRKHPIMLGSAIKSFTLQPQKGV